MGRARWARREGIREEPVMLRLLMCRQLKSGGYGLDGGAHPSVMTGGELLSGSTQPGMGGHGERLRRNRGEAAGAEPGAGPADRLAVNAGTARAGPGPVLARGRVPG